MLLVHDHEAERRHRRRDGRSRADHDRRAAGGGGAPGLEARAVGERGVQCDHRRRETCAKARDELRRQRDLGHEHERAAARLEHALDEPQVHLRLAAAGNAVQEESLKLPERGSDARDRRALVGRQHRPGPAEAGRRRRLGPRLGFEPAALREIAHDGLVPGFRDRRGARALGAEERNERLLPPAEAGARRDRRAPRVAESPDDRVAHGGRALAQHLRHRAEQHVAERVVVVVGGPQQQVEGHVVPQRHRVEHIDDGLQARARQRALRRVRGDETDRAALSERHAHALAGPRHALAGGGQVVEAAPQRRVEDDLEDGRRLGQKNL